ncbi:multidrug effflux MFS transporter [Streptomyces poonensis]|uniref:Bcr/CflA family drug resistance efflux transporter n=1 Tax=Streptomyces poonensis TaxID=68255 RepID=A0A918PHT8_9ACTN|nr:multidrug effflux MFS transporter [Streptomyces poonensis]GGZ10770.1 Bcr/CflA family drug resistance efflux transporter [Streptomyces poonensis]GLJ91422.1 Bcr/CflA family drug resistance efflux transporter [Streptomyces poonensis]
MPERGRTTRDQARQEDPKQHISNTTKDTRDSRDTRGSADTRTPAGDRALRASRRTGLLVTLVLGGLTATPPLAMDMYLPALPEVTEALSAPAATVQLTLTACLLGMALGQLVVGPMSDRWGRRRPLLAGLAVYVVATALCAVAPTVETLVALRLVQGLAGAAGIVIARAVVRDLYDGVAMARFFSTLMLISGVAPIVAPLIGGQILRATDWRGVFVVLVVLGVALTAVVWARLPETLPPAERHAGGVGETLRAMRGLLADRVFTGYMLAGGFTFATLFAYVSASPFVVQEIFGASPQTFSLLFGVNSVGLVIAGQVNGRILVGRVSLERVLAVGLGVVTVAAVALLLMTTGVLGEVGLVPVSAALFVLMSAMGITLPNMQTLALLRVRHAAGSASALLGTSSFLIGAVASPLVGIAGEDTAVPMAVVQLAAVLVAVGCFVALCRPWKNRAALEEGAGS